MAEQYTDTETWVRMLRSSCSIQGGPLANHLKVSEADHYLEITDYWNVIDYNKQKIWTAMSHHT